MKEEWRVVEEAPKYLVSNKGRVQNSLTGRILKWSVSKKIPYPRVNLESNGKWFLQGIHILVAKAFVPGYQAGLVVKHIDGDNTNFKASNLKLITRSESLNSAREKRFSKNARSWEVSKTGKLIERKRKR